MKRPKLLKKFTHRYNKTSLILIISLVIIIILTLPIIIKSLTSSSYEITSPTLSSSAISGDSSNYQTISTLGELGADVFLSSNYQIQIGFPASLEEQAAAHDEPDGPYYGDDPDEPSILICPDEDCEPDTNGNGNDGDPEDDCDCDGTPNKDDDTPVGPDFPPPGSEGDPTDANNDGDYLDPKDDYDGDGIPNKDDKTPWGDKIVTEPGSEGEPTDANGDGDYTDPEDDYDGDGIPNKDDKTPWGEEKANPEAIPDAIGKTLDNILNAINNAIPEQVKNALPVVVIREIVGTIGDTIGNIRDNETIANTLNRVVGPAMGTVAFISAISVIATSTTVQISNIVLLLIRFGYFWMTVPLTLKKRKEPWGVVFDSTTGQPIKSAIVRLFAREFDKLKETQITDAFGRFGFLVEPGEYYIHVTKPGFVFPSSLITANVIKGFQNIYRDAILTVKEKMEAAININIPLDPERKQLTRAQLLRIKTLNLISMIIESLNKPLLIAGTFLSWVSLVVTPKLSNYIILLVYAVLLTFRLILSRKVRRSWGQVLDAETEKPIEMALIRIYNLKGGTLTFTKVTNRDGQFTALVNTGKYYLVITKQGYQTYQSVPITVERARGIIRLDIYLRKEGFEPREHKGIFKEKPIYTA